MWIRMKDDYVVVWVNGDPEEPGTQETEDLQQKEATHA
jgi:hypothetical protein